MKLLILGYCMSLTDQAGSQQAEGQQVMVWPGPASLLLLPRSKDHDLHCPLPPCPWGSEPAPALQLCASPGFWCHRRDWGLPT